MIQVHHGSRYIVALYLLTGSRREEILGLR
jgi:hypothetical protein